jgi:ComF family protein
MQVNNWSFFVRSTLFPHYCPVCDAPLTQDLALCPACYAELPVNSRACPLCALPSTGETGQTCGQCLQRPPPYTASYVPLLYHPPLSQLIGELKFGHKLHLVRTLSRLFCELLPGNHPLPELIVPVPLHPHRLRERGFNQAQELARGVAAELNLKIDRRHCRRTRPTPPQTELDLSARRRNLKSAFQADAAFAGRHIALFDDVITTGSTVTAASQALLRSGAQRIDVWALARTPEP